ncbi:MAG: hypothetical protein JWP96_1049 [Polaromonas sp.]|nr:hypothetical protein [Polaromonas sp.]
MFSDQLKKVDKFPSRAFFLGIAGLVFFSLVTALVLVANGQVEKAQLRQAQYNAAQIAIADCSTTYSGAARSQCIEQVNVALTPYSTYTPETEVAATTLTSQFALQGKIDTPSDARENSLMRAAFARQ